MSSPSFAMNCLKRMQSRLSYSFMAESIRLQSSEGVGALTLSSPETRNALSLSLLEALLEGLDTFENDDSLRLVTLEAEGAVFSAGMDLKTIDLRHPQEAEAVSTLLSDVYQKMLFLRTPLIVAVDGPVYGGAAGLVLSADWIVLGPGAALAFPEVRIGLVPAMVSVVAQRRLSPGKFSALATIGAPLSSEEAFQLGLADQIATASAQETVARLAERLCHDNAPGAMQRTKSFLRRREEDSLRSSFEEARVEFLMSVCTPEAARGVAAFRRKERIDWSQGGQGE